MANRKLVGELVAFYWELDDSIAYINALGNVATNEIVELSNLQSRLNKILTNISPRWANGNRTRGYVPIVYIQTPKEDNAVRVTINTL